MTVWMAMAKLLTLGGLVVLAGGFTLVYNTLVRLDKRVDRAWSDIDVLLKQRRDELPKLIDAVRAYAAHEARLLKALTNARTQVDLASTPSQQAWADRMVRESLFTLPAVAEGYPQLVASERFQALQERVWRLEAAIHDRRRRYNDVVNRHNVRIDQVPHNAVALLMGLEARELFEPDPPARADVEGGHRLRA